jgi:toluene monooxygenase system protein E
MIDELLMESASDLANHHGDPLLGQVFYSLNEDCKWHREWSGALVKTAVEDNRSNFDVIRGWIRQWRPGADQAIEALSALYEGATIGGGANAFKDVAAQVTVRVNEYLDSLNLQP